ncbi:hypothetical protein [Gilliamella apis]|uniref:Lipocalin-like domain-containing protein n=1 Tax=Gilliamella apis TaxID=1970738 RepID=A0A2V4DN37_9GAMM|nr:hypothetical protein [Gilliamella apis]PXY91425.1 hypothetical protein DKK78_03585 [Gilliamella apis]WLS93588.1 hypothetical protein RAM17_10095 [Gilliamella apis]
MKNLLLISLIGLTLFGCEEKKITEEMLLGEWNCKLSTQEAESKNGKLQDFGDPEIGEYKYIFIKKDGQLFWGLSEHVDHLFPFNLEDIYKKTEYTVDDRQISQKIEYLSNDSFRMTDVTATIDKNNKPTSKTKDKLVCERIKE